MEAGDSAQAGGVEVLNLVPLLLWSGEVWRTAGEGQSRRGHQRRRRRPSALILALLLCVRGRSGESEETPRLEGNA
jgi:hypothetical protein